MATHRISLFSLAALAGITFTAPAAASIYEVNFTGIITNANDQGSALFHNGVNGQIGQTISGQILIDTAGYADQNASIYNGVYGPTNGLFPQPLNYFLSSFTIDGQTFHGSEFMGPNSQHSLEQAAIQNIPPVNYNQQDIIEINDGSQMLYCSDSNNPASCNGGALATHQLNLKLFGIYDFVSSDALSQVLNLNTADINAIVASAGGGQANGYTLQSYDTSILPSYAWLYNASGQFDLTSLSIGPQQQSGAGGPIPEPATMALCAVGFAGLALSRRRRQIRTESHY